MSGLKSRALGAVNRVLKPLGVRLARAEAIEDPYNIALYQRLCSPETLQRKPFYNVGAGSFHHPYWTNIDYVSDWYEHVQQDVLHHDLMALKPLPIEDGTAKIIYTSHTIEHVSNEAVMNLFKSAYKALNKGGILRVTTGPDAETDFRALMADDPDWFYWDEDYAKPGEYEAIYRCPATEQTLEERWLHHVASELAQNDISPSKKKFSGPEIRAKIDELGFPAVLDYFADLCEFNPERPGNHISWWSHTKLIDYMKEAGFETVYRSGHHQSASPLMRRSPLFDSTHPQISIYVEAVK